LSITAYGRDGAPRNRIGFGDDVAVSAGLTIAGDPPMFVADAVADPITGLYAAAAGLACLGATRSHLVDASLFRATRYVAHDSSSPAVSARLGAAAAPPRARTATAAAEAVGASTDEIVATFVPDARRDGRAKMPGPRSGEGDL